MERQCRLCFESEEITPFQSPCNCRGTQAYIHTHCLALYVRHYPDGICRVCLVRMKDVGCGDDLFSIGVLLWILALSYASTLPSDPRGMYLTLVGGVIVYYCTIRKFPIFFVTLGMVLSAICLSASPETVLWCLAIGGGMVTALILWMYIPSAFLLMGAAILMASAYSLALLFITYNRMTPLITAVALCLLASIWYFGIRARPPLRIL